MQHTIDTLYYRNVTQHLYDFNVQIYHIQIYVNVVSFNDRDCSNCCLLGSYTVVLQAHSDVSEKRTVSFLRVVDGRVLLRNVDILLRGLPLSQPRRSKCINFDRTSSHKFDVSYLATGQIITGAEYYVEKQ